MVWKCDKAAWHHLHLLRVVSASKHHSTIAAEIHDNSVCILVLEHAVRVAQVAQL